MANHTHFKLGKQPARHDPRTLMLAAYVTTDLPEPPPKVDYGTHVGEWPMYANDKLGDCTCAAVGHMIEAWTHAAQGKTTRLSMDDVLRAYEVVSGYDPATGRNDDGAVELDVLKLWRNKGIGSHKISGFVSVEAGNHLHIKQAAVLFGGVYIGLALPISAQGQKIWTVPSGGATGPGAKGSWGGHAVNVVAYDAHGLTVITWGKRLRMTWTFWDTYCDEAYAVLSEDFVSRATQKAPPGLDFATLMRDLKAL